MRGVIRRNDSRWICKRQMQMKLRSVPPTTTWVSLTYIYSDLYRVLWCLFKCSYMHRNRDAGRLLYRKCKSDSNTLPGCLCAHITAEHELDTHIDGVQYRQIWIKQANKCPNRWICCLADANRQTHIAKIKYVQGEWHFVAWRENSR